MGLPRRDFTFVTEVLHSTIPEFRLLQQEGTNRWLALGICSTSHSLLLFFIFLDTFHPSFVFTIVYFFQSPVSLKTRISSCSVPWTSNTFLVVGSLFICSCSSASPLSYTVSVLQIQLSSCTRGIEEYLIVGHNLAYDFAFFVVLIILVVRFLCAWCRRLRNYFGQTRLWCFEIGLRLSCSLETIFCL
jgi:hypothetical protein